MAHGRGWAPADTSTPGAAGSVRRAWGSPRQGPRDGAPRLWRERLLRLWLERKQRRVPPYRPERPRTWLTFILYYKKHIQEF